MSKETQGTDVLEDFGVQDTEVIVDEAAVIEDEISYIPKEYYDDIPEDVTTRVPALKLIQPTTDQDEVQGKLGNWYVDGLGEIEDPIILPIQFSWARYLRETKDRNAPVVCQSPNGREGFGNPGGNCFECPMNKWEGKKPPICTEVFGFNAFELTQQVPVRVSFAKSGFSAGKQLTSIVKARKLGNVVVKLGSVKKTSAEGGIYYVPTIHNLPISEVTQYIKDYREMKALEAPADES